MTCGIYKITSPNGRIYIGQSCRIEARWTHYKAMDCKDQPKLYNSFLKYGVKNHEFAILEECEIFKLNERERYWQEYYNVITQGLNCTLVSTDSKSGHLSEDTKRKISDANRRRSNRKNYSHSKETKEKIGLANKGKKPVGFKGNHTEESKQKMSLAKQGKVTSAETKLKLSLIAKGKPSKLKGRIFTEEERKIMYSTRRKIKNICKHN
jgi:group I intron endonuclease